MKFKEAIEKIDKSKNNEEYVDIEKIAEALSMDFYQNPEQERLKSYWLTCWLCTDTWVGSRIYFLDDEAVCWSFQGGRKSDEEFSWFSKEAAEKTREYILSLKEKEDLNVDLTSIDDEIGETYKINFNSQVLDWKKALYQGKSFEFIERILEKPNYGIDQKIKIRTSTGEEKIVNIEDIDFKYHTN